jgi:hypothetical protein
MNKKQNIPGRSPWTMSILLAFITVHLAPVFSAKIFAVEPIIIDHTCTDIWTIPTNWVNQARQKLHIAYGHTSHGYQITYGMSALKDFMNAQGYPEDLFSWRGDHGNWLDLSDTPFTGADDLGVPNWTAWEAATRTYLKKHPACNVIMWAWCGEVSWATEANINTYLGLMDGLRRDYTNVTFVHMTGHLDGTGTNGNLNLRNHQIRNHCLTNGEVLYDFADIESYDPDGFTNFMALLANDNCDYDSNGDGVLDGNWAINWQNTHTQGEDWFQCSTPHSQPLNGNQKAYAAWWLWARLAGWSGPLQPMRLLIRSDVGGQPVITCFRKQGDWSNGFDLMSSHDLMQWSNVPPAALSNQVEPSTNGLERIEIRLNGDVPSSPAFFRLFVRPN